MYMFKYVLKRLLLLLLTFFIIITVSFVLVKLLPDTPIKQLGKDPTLIMNIKVARHQYYINEAGEYIRTPIIEQYIYYLGYAFKGDFGVSELLYPGQDVWKVFSEKVPFTVAVNLYSILFSIPLGIGLGIVAAVKKNTWIDHLISTGVMIFVSVPSFIYGFLVQYLLCFKLHWFEPVMNASNGAFSWTGFSTMIPAVLCLAFGSIAGFARYTRAELTEVLTGDYMLLARTKGLTRGQATMRHALRNAMVPIFPMILSEFVGIMSGSLIIEGMFTIPGVGSLFVNSIRSTPNPDYNFFILLSAFYILIGLVAGIVADISYGFIDPRIRMGAK